MRSSRTSVAGLVAVALLLAACTSSGSSPSSLASSAKSNAPSATASPTSTVAPVPAVPTNFAATPKTGSVPCPSVDGSCSQTDFAWQATADPGTGFRIYSTGLGLDPNATCATEQAGATVALEAKPSARTAQIFDEMSVGGGPKCYWITSVSSSGESAQVPATGN